MESRTSECGRARTACAFAVEDLVGIALDILCLSRIEAESVADKLLENSLMALTLRVRAREKNERARAVKAHFGAFGARGAGTFDRVRQAEAKQLATFARFGLARFHALSVRKVEREI